MDFRLPGCIVGSDQLPAQDEYDSTQYEQIIQIQYVVYGWF